MDVLGSRSHYFKQQMQHLLLGSIARQVQYTAPCPVLIVLPCQSTSPHDSVIWYEEAIQCYLHNHPTLTVFTPQLVVQKFAPRPRKLSGPRELEAAAAKALGLLEQRGLLCRREVQGEVCYIND
ncbi:MAG TPA: hypothetical protein VN207_06275 [Ktedonobacteraceae bacterium]|nr:hypothetical protein [Ktedonobacteraceae bacterium]